MPRAICSFCSYLGQGIDFDSKLKDVTCHEEYCKENPLNYLTVLNKE